MQRRTPPPAWIAGAALTVLSSAVVAAVTLTSAPYVAAEGAPAGRVAAATLTPPVPVTLSFPAPAAAPAVAAPPQAAAPREASEGQPPAAAPRPADPLCAGAGWQQRRGQAAVARLRRPADARAVPVTFRPARADVLGMADLLARRVDVFVRPCAKQSDGLLLHVLAHELGHVVDVSRMDADRRARWMQLRGIPAGTPWFGCDRCTDFATPAGDFAETYAQWQRGAASSRSELAPAPSPAQLAELAAEFFRPL